MKKLFSGFLCATTMLVMVAPTFAANANKVNNVIMPPVQKSAYTAVKYSTVNYTLKINGKNVNLGTVKMVKINNKIMIPLEPTAKALGLTVKYDAKKKAINVSDGKMQSDLALNDSLYCAYSVKAIGMTSPENLGVAPTKINGVTYVPVEFYKILFTNPNCVSIKNNIINISTTSDKTTKASNSTQIANPLVSYNTLDEARKAVGFNFAVPSVLPDNYKMKDIIVISNELAEIFYRKGNNEILYRTSKTSGDISGDYNVYSTIKTITVGDMKVTVKGSKDTINLATWSNNGISFSLSSDEGINEKTLSSIITSIR